MNVLFRLTLVSLLFATIGCRSGSCPFAPKKECASPAACCPATSGPTAFKGAAPLEWSVRMADSETARRGDRLAWSEGGPGRWDYTAGLFTLSLLKLNEVNADPQFVEFTKKAIGTFIGPDGAIHGYQLEDYNIDNIAPGKTVIALWLLTHEEKYRKCAALLRSQLDNHPRVSGGGFWHKKRYTNQMWLDGLFMGAPFYAEYTKVFNGPKGDFDDVVKQFRLINEHLYDKKTGLYFHGWDEKKEQQWANHSTGTSSNFWGRGLGWYAMACVDVLDFLPKNHPGRKIVIDQVNQVAEGVVKWQDPKSGLWWQVLDKGGQPGNYLEATASAMFVYALARGINEGYLPDKFKPAVLKGYQGIIDNLIKTDPSGKISLTRCCSVAGLGYGRDGSYEYYLREPVVDNDLKGVGPFILAGIEIQQMLGLTMNVPANKRISIKPVVKKSIAPEWSQVDDILKRIKEPVFPGRQFSIVDFGATSDGKDSSEAIAKAIDACSAAGGGRVIVPAGTYLTGPITLKSRVDLHLDHGATLKFKNDPQAYLPAVRSWFEGMECFNYAPLIRAYGAENIAITGEGVLDGQADNTHWWPWKGKTEFGWSTGAPKQEAARTRLIQMVADGTPVEERHFGEGDYLRPSFIEPFHCKNVLIEGIRIHNSPMWELHPTLCTNVIVRGVSIVTHGPNNDGCDPESCTDVLIEDCLFDTGDDCIAIKSGRNNDGRRIGVPSQNIIVRNCTMKDGHGGVTVGSEISGGARNIFVEDCNMDSVNLDRVLRIKSNAVRGGVQENIFMRDITVGQVADAVLQIDFVYEEGANGPHKPVARNIVMENITVSHTPRVLNVKGFPESEISGIRIYNSTFKEIVRDDVVENADVKLIDCKLEKKQ